MNFRCPIQRMHRRQSQEVRVYSQTKTAAAAWLSGCYTANSQGCHPPAHSTALIEQHKSDRFSCSAASVRPPMPGPTMRHEGVMRAETPASGNGDGQTCCADSNSPSSRTAGLPASHSLEEAPLAKRSTGPARAVRSSPEARRSRCPQMAGFGCPPRLKDLVLRDGSIRRSGRETPRRRWKHSFSTHLCSSRGS